MPQRPRPLQRSEQAGHSYSVIDTAVEASSRQRLLRRSPANAQIAATMGVCGTKVGGFGVHIAESFAS
jgi:hypothetical protein